MLPLLNKTKAENVCSPTVTRKKSFNIFKPPKKRVQVFCLHVLKRIRFKLKYHAELLTTFELTTWYFLSCCCFSAPWSVSSYRHSKSTGTKLKPWWQGFYTYFRDIRYIVLHKCNKILTSVFPILISISHIFTYPHIWNKLNCLC